jgi:hypothetical protein
MKTFPLLLAVFLILGFHLSTLAEEIDGSVRSRCGSK